MFFCVCLLSVRFDIQPGREGFIDFKSGQEFMVYRAKNGHLMVVSLKSERVKFNFKGKQLHKEFSGFSPGINKD